MIKLFRKARPEERLPPVEMREILHTEEKSFGKDFNLIRAVDEYGNERIKEINKLTNKLREEIAALETERQVLLDLTAVVHHHKEKKNVR